MTLRRLLIAVAVCLSLSTCVVGLAAKNTPGPGPTIWAESGMPPLIFSSLEVGTGFFLTSDGDIITDRHVVAGCRRITISGFGFKALPVELLAYDPDPDVDLALLRAEIQPPEILSFVPVSQNGDPKTAIVGLMQKLLAVDDGNAIGIGYFGREVEAAPATFPVQFTHTVNTDGQKHFDPVVQGIVRQGESGSPILVSGQVAGIFFQGFGDPHLKPATASDWLLKTPDGDSANRGLVTPAPVAAAFARSLGAKLARGVASHPGKAVVRIYCFENSW